ncbi:Trm112 family protein [Archangium minus]|uniref:Trm112 family protein n=1 Tax=Archangium minus TaxID=83450 RepID=A0ABY9WU90_9BACT|nr:Trm112 family protein [Archangium minus]
MPLPDWLFETLACPKCKNPLPLPLGEGRGEGIKPPGSTSVNPHRDELHCENCRLAYPIRGGVPELLLEESHPLPSSGS